MQSTIGWDIGGAHLKGARVEAGHVVALATVACPLWQGVEGLDAAFASANSILGDATHHVVTMTGEMSDVFSSRKHGVASLIECTSRQLKKAASLYFYAGARGFVEGPTARIFWREVASANWHATARYVGQKYGDALLIDMGSTTVDIIPILKGKVASIGKNDAERAGQGELVYTGLTRSFVSTLAHRAPFDGAWCNLMQEYFANTADVYRILGQLPDGIDLMASADGREKTISASCARLARMIGRDAKIATLKQWQDLALFFADRQQRLISDNARHVLSRRDLASRVPVICAGIGRKIVEPLTLQWGRVGIGFDTLVPAPSQLKSQCADSASVVALTLLAANL